jgi:hypothetical protein
MFITSAGNVGIGTNNPTTPLHVRADTPSIRLEDVTSSDNHYLTGNNGELRIQSTGFMTMRPGNAVSTTFSANGNVGIGTTAPAYKLDVAGSARVDGVLRVGTTAQNGEIKIIDSNGKTFSLNSGNVGNNKFAIEESGTSARYLVIDGVTSNVGIGTTSPSQKLEVDGQVLSDGYRLAAMQTAPAARNSAGTLGEIVIDGNHIYVCYATDSWSRVALDTSW